MLVTRGLDHVVFSPGPWGLTPLCQASMGMERGEKRIAGEGWRPCPERGLENEENWGSTAVLKETPLPEICLGLCSWGQRVVLHPLPRKHKPFSQDPALFQSSIGSIPALPPSPCGLAWVSPPGTEWDGQHPPVAMVMTPAPSLPVALSWTELQAASAPIPALNASLPSPSSPFLSWCLVSLSLSQIFF